MNSQSPLGQAISIDVVRILIEGKPSSAYKAWLRFNYKNKPSKVISVSFEPDGIMYEVFVEQISAIRQSLLDQ